MFQFISSENVQILRDHERDCPRLSNKRKVNQFINQAANINLIKYHHYTKGEILLNAGDVTSEMKDWSGCKHIQAPRRDDPPRKWSVRDAEEKHTGRRDGSVHEGYASWFDAISHRIGFPKRAQEGCFHFPGGD